MGTLLGALAMVLVAVSAVGAQSPSVPASPGRSAATSRLAIVPIPAAFGALVVDGEPLPADMPVVSLFGMEQIASGRIVADVLDRPAIEIVLLPAGSEIFDAWAAAHIGGRIAIVVDGLVLAAPTINATEFGGVIQISGNFTEEAAEALARSLGLDATPLDVVPSKDAAARLVLAMDPRFASLPNCNGLATDPMSVGTSSPLTGSCWDTIATWSVTLHGYELSIDKHGSWIVEVMLVGDCAPVPDPLATTSEPCAWRHSWLYRVQPDGTVTPLFEEGDPDPAA